MPDKKTTRGGRTMKAYLSTLSWWKGQKSTAHWNQPKHENTLARLIE